MLSSPSTLLYQQPVGPVITLTHFWSPPKVATVKPSIRKATLFPPSTPSSPHHRSHGPSHIRLGYSYCVKFKVTREIFFIVAKCNRLVPFEHLVIVCIPPIRMHWRSSPLTDALLRNDCRLCKCPCKLRKYELALRLARFRNHIGNRYGYVPACSTVKPQWVWTSKIIRFLFMFAIKIKTTSSQATLDNCMRDMRTRKLPQAKLDKCTKN